MAKINAGIPEPTPEYRQENQRQIAQAIRTVQDQLNTSFQEELKQEVERFTWFNTRYGC
jgi:hypothetical protein